MVAAPDTLDALRRDIGRALEVMRKLEPGYTKAKKYGEGTAPEIAGSRVAQTIIDQAEAAPVSFAHIPVEVISEKVELASITAAEAQAKAILDKWFDLNDIDDEAQDWIRQACMLGDFYVIIDPTEEDEDGRAIVETARALASSPFDTVVVYDRRTEREAQYGLHVWDAGSKNDPRVRAMLYYDDASVKLISRAGSKGTTGGDFELDVDPDEDDADAWIFHNGDRMLISHLAIGGKPYGVPVHKKAWGPQDAITKISANNLVNVDAQGLPSRWALMDPAAELDDDIDDDFGTDGPSSTTSDGLTKATAGPSRVRAVPGAIAMLRGVKQVGTFDQGSSDTFLKNLDWYVRAMAVATGIALFEFDLNGEQPSGEARRRAEGRANRKAARIKRQAAAFFRDLADTVLALTGVVGTVTVNFNPSETSTDKDGLELVALKVKAGVPVRAALLEAGYSAEQVEEWYPTGAPAVSPDLLTVLATALNALGNAKTLGVITDDELAAMLPEILTGARGEGPTVEAPAPELDGVVTNAAADMRQKADALGVLIRAGVDQAEAAEAVGLPGLTFPNLPTTIRVPERDAAGIEDA
ncbi:portal protein [Microbacterium phage OscarSo]|uniref:Portal protein n=1 Tax=Microbacterium phage OscarSo TaxID=2985324 RepID=A0A9X9P6D0_9CAUD|nr:portal protein [Microbacterium phage OscarSo]UYL87132.1 portal protein [Microbacterium phage OscarSo]